MPDAAKHSIPAGRSLIESRKFQGCELLGPETVVLRSGLRGVLISWVIFR